MRIINLLLLLFVMIYWTVAPVSADVAQQELILSKQIIDKGNRLMSKQMFKEALQEYEKCLAVNPESAIAKSNIILLHNNWGIYYFHHNQYQDAQAEWQTALKLDPNDSKAKNNLLILKNALARLGLKLENQPKLPPEKAEQENQANKEENSSVVILNTHKNNDVTTPDTPAVSPIEEKLTHIEQRVYGRTIDDLSIIKRLEKLEIDSFGQISDLPILERINKLNTFYKEP